MRKKRYDRDIVILLVTSLITLVTWVGFEVYRAYTQIEIPEVLQRHLQSFDSHLDTAVLDQLETRQP